jgi:phthiocerol/phenolphthiocerol synthesis type-I polyketide synthase C
LALEPLLASTAGNLALIDLDWATLSRFLPASQAPKFSGLARSMVGQRSAHAESAQELRRRVAALAGSELAAALTEIVRAEVAEILRIAPERIEAGTPLLDMGMDSLMAVELAASIESALDIQLSALALSGGPTIESVVERIVRLLHPVEGASVEDTANTDHREQVLVAAARHMGDLSAENAAQFGIEIGDDTAAPLSLTARQRQ